MAGNWNKICNNYKKILGLYLKYFKKKEEISNEGADNYLAAFFKHVFTVVLQGSRHKRSSKKGG